MTTPWHNYMTGTVVFHANAATHWETEEAVADPEGLLRFEPKQITQILQNLRRRRNNPLDITGEQEN